MILLWQVAVRDLYILTMIILLWIVLLVCFLIAFSFFRNRRLAKENRWQSLVTSTITDAIINNEVIINPHVQLNMKHEGFRNMFLNDLVATEGQFMGASFKNIKGLFQEYGLEPYVLKKLNNRKDFVVAKGIRELHVMKVDTAIPILLEKLNHPSPEIYQQAQYAIVYLQGFGGLAFLNDLKHPLSDWQQVKLLSCIKLIPTDGEERISKWLQSENTSVCVFAIKLIRQCQLFNFIDQLLNLLEHQNTNIRIQAVKSLDMLEGSSTSSYLKNIFDKQAEDVQIEIIKLLQKFRNKLDKNFLLDLLSSDTSNRVKVLAAESLVIWRFEEELIQLANKDLLAKDLSLIINHALRAKLC